MLQHDAMSWQIEGSNFVSASLSESAIKLHETLHSWLENIDENGREQFVNDLFSILESTGVKTGGKKKMSQKKQAASSARAGGITDGVIWEQLLVFSFRFCSSIFSTTV